MAEQTVVIGNPGMDEQAYRSPLPPVGLPVVWYERGTLSSAYFPATVIRTYPDRGTVDLMVQRTRDGIPKAFLGVWHSSNPALERCPHDVKSSRGCWGYLPGAPGMAVDLNLPSGLDTLTGLVADLAMEVARLKGEAVLPTVSEDDDRDDDVDKRILELSSAGKSVTEICAECRVPHQKVNAVLRKRSTV